MSLLETWISVFPSLTTEDTLREAFVQQSQGGGLQILVTYVSINKKDAEEDGGERRQEGEVSGAR